MDTPPPINKQISISGTNNRYQIKKLTEEKKVVKRKKMEQIPPSSFSHELQKVLLSNLTRNPELPKMDLIIKDSDFGLLDLLSKEIKKKITSYKQQDLTKKKFHSERFITFLETLNLLEQSQLTCHYCFQPICLLYENVRDPKQWTLDRLDNLQGHTKENVVICCLECNLHRRTTSKDAFVFTKQLHISREGYI